MVLNRQPSCRRLLCPSCNPQELGAASHKLVLTGGMIDKLKQKLSVASKAVAELEELLADIGSKVVFVLCEHEQICTNLH